MAKKVLVIDEDVNTVKFLSVALEENAYEPQMRHNGTHRNALPGADRTSAL